MKKNTSIVSKWKRLNLRLSIKDFLWVRRYRNATAYINELIRKDRIENDPDYKEKLNG